MSVCYTDGSTLRNGSKKAKGGIGGCFPGRPDLNFGLPYGTSSVPATNNRCELAAVLHAAKIAVDNALPAPLLIKTDSELVCNTCNKWLGAWKKRGWLKADRKPPANMDLLTELDAVLTGGLRVQHVRAHTGGVDDDSKMNEMADRLARTAACTCQ